MTLKSFYVKMPMLFIGLIAQRLEPRTHNPLVPGSNPGGPNEQKAVSDEAAFLCLLQLSKFRFVYYVLRYTYDVEIVD